MVKTFVTHFFVLIYNIGKFMHNTYIDILIISQLNQKQQCIRDYSKHLSLPMLLLRRLGFMVTIYFG